MIKLIVFISAVIATAAAPCADMDVATNVYARVVGIYASQNDTLERSFRAVRGGSFYNELNESEYMPFCEYVSNHCSQIVADWPIYETNEMVRYTTLCAIGFSGFANYTNAIDKILSGYEANSAYCSWETVRILQQPYGTPSYLSLDWAYDKPGISNLVLRIRAIAASQAPTNRFTMSAVEACDDVLSGAGKVDCQDLMLIDNWRPPITE